MLADAPPAITRFELVSKWEFYPPSTGTLGEAGSDPLRRNVMGRKEMQEIGNGQRGLFPGS